jgi:hypothetical protein
VQKLTDRVVVQLNDLPGFPARPTTVPPAPDRWVFGDWLVECHVHPSVVSAAALPTEDNRLGDVRVCLLEQSWCIWDGSAWQPMTGGGGGGTPSVVDTPVVAQEDLVAGDLVCFVYSGGAPKVCKADATSADGLLNPVGFVVTGVAAGASTTVRVSGVASVPTMQFDGGPGVANVGQRVFVSITAGKITLTAPSASGSIVQRAGVLVDGSANPKVLVQIGDPVLI